MVLHHPGTLPVLLPIAGNVLALGTGALSLEWLVDGLVVSSGPAVPGPVELLHAFGDGIHTVALRVTAGDQVSVSTTRVEIGDHTPPSFEPVGTVTVTAFSGAIPNYVATVQVFDPDGADDPPPVVTQSIAAGTVVGPGFHDVVLTATDAAGNVNITHAAFFVAPVVRLTSPANYASFAAGEPISVNYSVLPGVAGISGVVLRANGTTVATLPLPAAQSTITLPPGEYSLEAVAFGPGGVQSLSTPIFITVQPPAGVTYSGSLHTATGGAVLTLAGTSLVVSNIGSSGQDGVSIALGATTRTVVAFDPLESGGPLSNGAYVQLDARGTVNGVGNQPVGSLRATKIAGGFELLADSSAIGAGTHRVQVFNQGALVLDVGGYSGSVMATTGAGALGAGTAGFIARHPAGTTFTIGFLSAVGDEIRLLPEGSPSTIGYISSLKLSASGIATIAISGETSTPLPPPLLELTCIGSTFHLQLAPTVPNAQYRVDASTDLLNWTPFGTFTAPGITLELDVPAAYSSGPRWFYRAQGLPPP